MLQKLKDIWYRSWTKLWAWMLTLPSLIVSGLHEVGQAVPAVKEYLGSINDLPQWLTLGVATIGLITYVAHGHGND